MMVGLQELLPTGLDETGFSELVVDAARLRREEIDIGEAARAAWVAKRDLGAFHQHEWAVAAIPDPFEERSHGEHRDSGHSRFHRQCFRYGCPDQVAPERFECSEPMYARMFGSGARQQGVDGGPEVLAALSCRVGWIGHDRYVYRIPSARRRLALVSRLLSMINS